MMWSPFEKNRMEGRKLGNRDQVGNQYGKKEFVVPQECHGRNGYQRDLEPACPAMEAGCRGEMKNWS